MNNNYLKRGLLMGLSALCMLGISSLATTNFKSVNASHIVGVAPMVHYWERDANVAYKEDNDGSPYTEYDVNNATPSSKLNIAYTLLHAKQRIDPADKYYSYPADIITSKERDRGYSNYIYAHYDTSDESGAPDQKDPKGQYLWSEPDFMTNARKVTTKKENKRLATHYVPFKILRTYDHRYISRRDGKLSDSYLKLESLNHKVIGWTKPNGVYHLDDNKRQRRLIPRYLRVFRADRYYLNEYNNIDRKIISVAKNVNVSHHLNRTDKRLLKRAANMIKTYHRTDTSKAGLKFNGIAKNQLSRELKYAKRGMIAEAKRSSNSYKRLSNKFVVASTKNVHKLLKSIKYPIYSEDSDEDSFM